MSGIVAGMFGIIRGMDLRRQMRQRHKGARARASADADSRALRLGPEVVAFWQLKINQAATFLEPGRSPCDDAPWSAALQKACDVPVPPSAITDKFEGGWPTRDLMAFVEDLASPSWPDPRRDLVEFALSFLEHDVMLFRSGYAKRHLLNRLRQSLLTPSDIDRLEAMLRRAVVKGTGLEEYRAFCRLAAHLVVQGYLGEFREWVKAEAQGAVLTLSMADARLWRQIADADLTDEDRRKVQKVRMFSASKWGLRWPEMNGAVPNIQDDRHRIRRNAWRMYDAILRREEAR